MDFIELFELRGEEYMTKNLESLEAKFATTISTSDIKATCLSEVPELIIGRQNTAKVTELFRNVSEYQDMFSLVEELVEAKDIEHLYFQNQETWEKEILKRVKSVCDLTGIRMFAATQCFSPDAIYISLT